METCAATLVCNFVEYSMEPGNEGKPVVPPSAPNGTYEAADGSVNLVTLNNEQFARVCLALEQPGIGTVAFAGIPVQSMRRPVVASPRIGEHTEAVLRDAGFAHAELGALLREGVVQQR